jgi:hypothetical protein
MISQELEFRGINRRQLEIYFEELGGKRVKESALFAAEDWEAQILSEEEISFTPVFKVNAVVIRFMAVDESCLEELIRKYRIKTTRVGG